MSSVENVIAPVTIDQFLADSWTQSPLHIAGPTGKFADLIDWDQLGALLESNLVVPPRLRLMRRGKQVLTNRYVARGQTPRLKAAALIGGLADGDSLVVDYVDEIVKPVRGLAEEFETIIGARVNVNLYAGWGIETALGQHWDGHEVMILQVAGRKEWRLNPADHPNPLDGEKINAPRGEPERTLTISDGDTLYLPRGWWHEVVPLGEPSLHLTVTMVPPTGRDFVAWLAGDLAGDDSVRKTLPTNQMGTEHVQTVEASLFGAIAHHDDEDALVRFLADWRAQIPMRPTFDLVTGPRSQAQDLTSDTQVQLAETRGFTFGRPAGDGTVRITTGNTETRCSQSLVDVLARLSGTESVAMKELNSALPDDESRGELGRLVAVLALKGAVWLT